MSTHLSNEPEFIRNKVEREARRLEVAFDVQRFECRYQSQYEAHFIGETDFFSVLCYVDVEGSKPGELHLIEVSNPKRDFCSMHRPYAPQDAPWQCRDYSNGALCEFMARGVYRLGIEEEDVFTALNCHLSAHEKLELRLSLPREFWPPSWLNEEAK